MTRKLIAECLGTALLLLAVIGSGIYGQTLSGGNTALALLANAICHGLYAVWDHHLLGSHFRCAF